MPNDFEQIIQVIKIGLKTLTLFCEEGEMILSGISPSVFDSLDRARCHRLIKGQTNTRPQNSSHIYHHHLYLPQPDRLSK